MHGPQPRDVNVGEAQWSESHKMIIDDPMDRRISDPLLTIAYLTLYIYIYIYIYIMCTNIYIYIYICYMVILTHI